MTTPDPSSIDVFGAAVILYDGDTFLFQEKTAGYFVPRFVGQLCFVGGGWTEAGDKTPAETALREMGEEFEPRSALVGAAERLEFVGTFELGFTREVTGTRAYRLQNFIYALQIEGLGQLGASLSEGRAALIEGRAALDRPFCWGYGHVLAHYARRRELVFPRALAPNPDVSMRLVSEVEPGDYASMDLSRLGLNPLG